MALQTEELNELSSAYKEDLLEIEQDAEFEESLKRFSERLNSINHMTTENRLVPNI